MRKIQTISHSELCELVEYFPATGCFKWKVSPRYGLNAGDLAGSFDRHGGYVHLRLKGVDYKAHRLAWFYIHKTWPINGIDHINGVKTDNRISNLREATHSENIKNIGITKRNTSGYKGVHWNAQRKKWVAQISCENRKIYLGLFTNPKDAHEAYVKASKELHASFSNAG